MTYQFRFKTTVGNPNTFLYNTARSTRCSTIRTGTSGRSTSVTRVDGAATATTRARLGDVPTPPVNIGPRSTPDYGALASAAVSTPLPGGVKVFAGQRDDPFFVDLGSVFDLAGLRPFNPVHLIPLPARRRASTASAGYNTHTIAIQVPIAASWRQDAADDHGP